MERLIVELFHRTGFRIPQRYRFREYPVRVGRAYYNDLIITDPHVCPEHLVICEQDEGWLLRDKDSKNGILHNHKLTRSEWIHIKSGDEIIIGKTRLRLLSPMHPVEESEILIDPGPINRLLSHPFIAIFMWFMLGIFIAVKSHAHSWTQQSFTYYVSEALPIMFLALCWTGIWALVGRVIRHRTRAARQLSMISLYLIILEWTAGLAETTAYKINNDLAAYAAFAVFWAASLGWLLSATLRAATHLTKRRRWIISGFIVSLISLSAFLVDYTELTAKQQYTRAGYSHILKIPGWRLAPDLTPEQFLDEANPVFYHPTDE